MKIHPVNVAVLSALAAWKAGFRCEIEGATPPPAIDATSTVPLVGHRLELASGT